MLFKIVVYKFVNKTLDHTSTLLLPHLIVFNPILFNQDFVKTGSILLTSTVALWSLLAKLYFTSGFFTLVLVLLDLMGSWNIGSAQSSFVDSGPLRLQPLQSPLYQEKSGSPNTCEKALVSKTLPNFQQGKCGIPMEDACVSAYLNSSLILSVGVLRTFLPKRSKEEHRHRAFLLPALHSATARQINTDQLPLKGPSHHGTFCHTWLELFKCTCHFSEPSFQRYNVYGTKTFHNSSFSAIFVVRQGI